MAVKHKDAYAYHLYIDGKQTDVNVDYFNEDGGADAYAKAYPGATIRMRDEKGKDYNVPLEKMGFARTKGLHPFKFQYVKEYTEDDISDWLMPGQEDKTSANAIMQNGTVIDSVAPTTSAAPVAVNKVKESAPAPVAAVANKEVKADSANSDGGKAVMPIAADTTARRGDGSMLARPADTSQVVNDSIVNPTFRPDSINVPSAPSVKADVDSAYSAPRSSSKASYYDSLVQYYIDEEGYDLDGAKEKALGKILQEDRAADARVEVNKSNSSRSGSEELQTPVLPAVANAWRGSKNVTTAQSNKAYAWDSNKGEWSNPKLLEDYQRNAARMYGHLQPEEMRGMPITERDAEYVWAYSPEEYREMLADAREEMKRGQRPSVITDLEEDYAKAIAYSKGESAEKPLHWDYWRKREGLDAPVIDYRSRLEGEVGKDIKGGNAESQAPSYIGGEVTSQLLGDIAQQSAEVQRAKDVKANADYEAQAATPFVEEEAKKVYQEVKATQDERAWEAAKEVGGTAFMSPIARATVEAREMAKATSLEDAIEKSVTKVVDKAIAKGGVADIVAAYVNNGFSADQAQDMAIENIATRTQQTIFDEYKAQRAPKSTLDYIMSAAMHNSIVGSLAQGLAGIDDTATQLNEEAIAEAAEKEGMLARVTGGVGSLVLDAPAFAMGGGIGGAVSKGATNLLSKGAAKMALKASGELGVEAGSRYLASSLTGRIAQASIASGTTLGAYDAMAEGARQFRVKDLDLGAIANRASHGFALGAMLGPIGQGSKYLSRNMSAKGKMMVDAGAFVTEAEVFNLGGSLLSGEKIDAGTHGEGFVESALTLLAMKGTHLITNPGGLKASIKARYNSPDYPNKARMTAEDLALMKQLGYDINTIFRSESRGGKGMNGGKAAVDVNAEFVNPEEMRNNAVKSDKEFLENYANMMKDANVPMEIKAKLALRVEGKVVESLPKATGMRETKTADGRFAVETLSSNGEVISRKEFSKKAEADKLAQEMMAVCEANSYDLMERAVDATQSEMGLQDVFNKIAAERGADARKIANDIYEISRKGERTPEEQALMDAFEATVVEVRDTMRTSEDIKSLVERTTGLNVEDVLKKPADKRTLEEVEALAIYRRELLKSVGAKTYETAEGAREAETAPVEVNEVKEIEAPKAEVKKTAPVIENLEEVKEIVPEAPKAAEATPEVKEMPKAEAAPVSAPKADVKETTPVEVTTKAEEVAPNRVTIEDVIEVFGRDAESAEMMRKDAEAYADTIEDLEADRQEAVAYSRGEAEKPIYWDYWKQRDGLAEPGESAQVSAPKVTPEVNEVKDEAPKAESAPVVEVKPESNRYGVEYSQIETRTSAWNERTGVTTKVVTDVDGITNKEARAAIAEGRRITGWYELATGDVVIYAPNVMSMDEVDKTYVHEVVSHKGINGLLGDKYAGEFYDKVYNDVMTDAEREHFNNYAGVGGIKDEKKRHRVAAEEYVANLAEKPEYDMTAEERSTWQQIVEYIRTIINKILGNGKLTHQDVKDTLRAAYQKLRYEAEAKRGPTVEEVKAKSAPVESAPAKERNNSITTAEGKSVSIKGYPEELFESEQPLSDVEIKDRKRIYRDYKNVLSMDELRELNQLNSEIDNRDEAFKKAIDAYLANKVSRQEIEAMAKQYDAITNRRSELFQKAHELKAEAESQKAKTKVQDIPEEVVEKLNAEDISVDTENGDARVRFSVRFSPDESEVKNIVENIAKTTGRSKAAVRKWVESEMSLTNFILDEHNAPFLDYKADDRHTAIKTNSDYKQGTVDFNNICRKRVDFTVIIDRLHKDFPSLVLSGKDMAIIRSIMKDNGMEVACGLCYVEDRRQLMDEVAQSFIDGLNDNFATYATNQTKEKVANKIRGIIGDDAYIPTIYDLIAPSGSKALFENHPKILEAFNVFNNARGQQSQNLYQGYAEYKREILKWNSAKVKSVNDNGGLRIFTYSDFEAHHLIDLVQIIQDCAVKGLTIQGYTKVPAFARVVENTNIKLNRSLIPLGDTGIKDGQLAFDSVEGIDMNDPNFTESTDNVGNILTGINDEQIRMAMADSRIHYIIPFHSNQAKELIIAKGCGAWTNYKFEQREYNKTGGAAQNGVNIYTDVLNAAEAEGNPIKNEKQFVEKFLQVCQDRDLIPRFARFLDKDAQGNYIYTPGYYKLLIDFKLFNENGKILPQKPVVANFDDAFNAKILEEYVTEERAKLTEGYNAKLDAVYNQIKDALNLNPDGGGKGTRFADRTDYSDMLVKAAEKASKGLKGQKARSKNNDSPRLEEAEKKKHSNEDKQDLTTVILSTKNASAKLVKNKEQAKDDLLKISKVYKDIKKTKGFLGDLKIALGEDPLRLNSSSYFEFSTIQGDITLRISNHNANGNTFDRVKKAISVIIKSYRSPNTYVGIEGLDLKEYAYFKEDIAKADGAVLSQIAESISNTLYSGEFVDTTGLAHLNPKVERSAESAEAEEGNLRFRIVEDPEEVAWFEESPKLIGYRNLVQLPDGSLRPPMADALRGNGITIPMDGFKMGEIIKSEETPEIVKENGKVDLVKPDGLGDVADVDYNPYNHHRHTLVNSQFDSAWERPNLVFVECEIPIADIETGYQADKAALPVGDHPWNGGNLILSRYSKAVGIVPWDRVADDWVDQFKDTGVNFNKVPPKLLPILAERGVEILPPIGGMGKACNDAYKAWKREGLIVGDNSLVGIHNISVEKLLKAINMGGLANPSAAIIDVNTGRHEGYGAISLILPSSKISKRTGKSAGTWMGDAYTPTYPHIEKYMTDAGEAKKVADLRNLPDDIRPLVRKSIDAWIDGSASYQDGLMYMFLVENDMTPEIVYKGGKYSAEVVDKVGELLGGEYSLRNADGEVLSKVLDEYIASQYNGDRAAYEEAFARRTAHLEKGLQSDRPFMRHRSEEALSLNEKYGFDYNSVQSWLNELGYEARTRGEIDEYRMIEDMRKTVDENGLRNEYIEWLDNLEKRYNVQERIFKGFNARGDRKYVPHTLENVSKDMKKEGKNGTQAGGSFANFTALLLPKKQELAGIREYKHNLHGEHEATEAFRDKWTPIYLELGEKLQKGDSGFATYGFARLAEAAQEIVKGRDANAYLKKEYGVQLSEKDVNQLKEMINAIQTEYPTMYFETKFERPVRLNEFASAVVPEGTSQKIINALEEAGLKIETYDSNVEGSRQEAVRRASEAEGIRFREGGMPWNEGESLMDALDRNYKRKSKLEIAVANIERKRDAGRSIDEDEYNAMKAELTKIREDIRFMQNGPTQPTLQHGETIYDESYANRMEAWREDLQAWKDKKYDADVMLDQLLRTTTGERATMTDEELREILEAESDKIDATIKETKSLIKDQIISRVSNIGVRYWDDVVKVKDIKSKTTAEERKLMPHLLEGSYDIIPNKGEMYHEYVEERKANNPDLIELGEYDDVSTDVAVYDAPATGNKHGIKHSDVIDYAVEGDNVTRKVWVGKGNHGMIEFEDGTFFPLYPFDMEYLAWRESKGASVPKEIMSDVEESLLNQFLHNEIETYLPNGIRDFMDVKYIDAHTLEVMNEVREWYDNLWYEMEALGMNFYKEKRDFYVTHIWDKKKSTPTSITTAQKFALATKPKDIVDVESYVATNTPYMRTRMFDSLLDGMALGLVPKYEDIADIILDYGHRAAEAIENRKMVKFLKLLKVNGIPALREVGGRNEGIYTVINNNALRGYEVLKDIKPMLNVIFGPTHTTDYAWLQALGKAYDIVGGLAKKIELSLSFFHHGALTETAIAMNGPLRTMKTVGKHLIWDCIKNGDIPAFNDPELTRDAVKHLVVLGATQDYATKDVQMATEKLVEWTRKIHGAHEAAKLVDFINKGSDKILWDYLHDGLKIYAYEKMAKEIRARAEREGIDNDTLEKMLNEAGQLVNDTFGGQHFELLGWSPSTVKWARRFALSPDWTVSTVRQALAPMGVGQLYNDEAFWKKYFKGDDVASVRKEYGRAFWLRAALFAIPLVTGINMCNRMEDEEEQKAIADEKRKTDPNYLSPYEMAYPDGMKWYDYTMYGNTVGHSTHLFMGRYEDGSEQYLRCGKQFRELPELMFGPDGFGFPDPLIHKMVGKLNPMADAFINLMSGHSFTGWQNEDMRDKEGTEKNLGRFFYLAKKFIPFAWNFDATTEFKPIDLVMPSTKGFSRSKAIKQFKIAIMNDDKDYAKLVMDACKMNNLNGDQLLETAWKVLEAEGRKNMVEGVETVDDAISQYDAEANPERRVQLKNFIMRQMSLRDIRMISNEQAVEQAWNTLMNAGDNSKPDKVYNTINSSEDVLQDWRMSRVMAELKPFKAEYNKQETYDEAEAYYNEHKAEIDKYEDLLEARRYMNELKRAMGDDADNAELLRLIREERKKALEIRD